MDIKLDTSDTLPAWDLSDLASGFDDPKFLAVFNLNTYTAFAATYKNKLLGLSGDELAQAFQDLEAILVPLYEASQFVSLRASINTAASTHQYWQQRIDQLHTDVHTALLFFKLELTHMTEQQYDCVMQSSKLQPYAYELQRCIQLKAFQLSEPEESILAKKSLHGSTAFESLYTELTSSFSFEYTYDGNSHTLNGEQLRALRHHPDKAVRAGAMQLFLDRYKANKIALGKSFIALISDYHQTYKLRGYPRAISVMNRHNDIPDETIDILHDITTASNHLVQRYYNLKARMLGQDRLSLSDIYAPIQTKTHVYTYDEAQALVLSALAKFDADFHDKAHHIIATNRIHAAVLPTKRGGAYCSSSTHRVAPYVMLNFLGKPRDVATMAHELGHAIHAQYSTHLPLGQQHAILPLCETASVFCELIISESLYQNAKTKDEKRVLLMTQLEDIMATSHRQNMFSQFEQAMHAALDNGPLSTDQLCQLYRAELTRLFGDAVDCPEHYDWEWLTIPHFLAVPFYVYAYNFGNLLVFGLYQRYKQDPSFVKDLKIILSAGSSASPTEILTRAGININDPAFWQASIQYIQNLVENLENL